MYEMGSHDDDRNEPICERPVCIPLSFELEHTERFHELERWYNDELERAKFP